MASNDRENDHENEHKEMGFMHSMSTMIVKCPCIFYLTVLMMVFSAIAYLTVTTTKLMSERTPFDWYITDNQAVMDSDAYGSALTQVDSVTEQVSSSF